MSSTNTELTRFFDKRDRQVRSALDDFMVNSNGETFVRLQLKMYEKIVTLIHSKEHSDRFALVLEQMMSVPTCKTCGSVSTIFSRSFFFTLVSAPRTMFPFFLFFQQYKQHICHRHIKSRNIHLYLWLICFFRLTRPRCCLRF